MLRLAGYHDAKKQRLPLKLPPAPASSQNPATRQIAAYLLFFLLFYHSCMFFWHRQPKRVHGARVIRALYLPFILYFLLVNISPLPRN